MSKSTAAGRARARQMLEIARRYYLADESKVQISEQLGISRFKVARLLEEARERGLVRITLDHGGEADETLSRQLARHLGLDSAVAVEAYGTVAEVRRIVGEHAGKVLAGTVRTGETLGLAWGRTLTHLIESIDHLPSVQILQLNGAVGPSLSQSPVELALKASLISGNNAKAIMAPLYIDDADGVQIIRSQPDIKDVLDSFDTVTTAIVAVGAINGRGDGSTDSRLLPMLPPAVREELLHRGAVAEACGLTYAADGSLAYPELARDHILAISARQLRRIPRVIAVASDPSKAQAVLALRRADVISELVVDAELAEALLALPAFVRGRDEAAWPD
ncbi:MAG: hypothetical protein KIT69_19660 [Propionibacteriaceae bacterium]|nr:hypothetical protein [Propionibacteriaceae bacterium]